MRMIEDWTKRWWRFWSVRVSAIGMILSTWVVIDPMMFLSLLNSMPVHIRGAIPERIMLIISIAIYAGVIFVRLVPQKKLEKTNDDTDKQ